MKTIFVVLLVIFSLTETYSAFSRTAMRGTSAWERERVLRNLYRHNHEEPFEYPSFFGVRFLGGVTGAWLILYKMLPEKSKK